MGSHNRFVNDVDVTMRCMNSDSVMLVIVITAIVSGMSEVPDIPYLVTIEILAPDLTTAVRYAQQGFGINAVESVVQKHRMTNMGTEWYRSANPKNRSKNNTKNPMENSK